jgi:predicted dehydrogenase
MNTKNQAPPDAFSRATDTSTPVRLALVGLKGINAWHYLPGIEAAPEAQLAGGVDPSPEAREWFQERAKAPAYPSLEEMLRHEKVDGVFIGTPNHLHLLNVREAVAAGLHVAVTKPLANTLEDCREAIRICREAGLLLQANHEYRFRPAQTAAIAMAQRGEIGEITMVTAHMGSNGGIAQSNTGTWRSDPRNVPGGCLNLLGIHMLDCANAVLGRPLAVSALLACLKSACGITDTTSMTVNYESGAMASVTSSYASSHHDSLVIYGTEANLVATEKGLHRMCKRELVAVEPLSTVSSAQVLVGQFCQAIRNDTPPEVPGEDGLLLVGMIEAAIRSSNEGRRVLMNEVL